MIDADVMRLRHLRNSALRARALALALQSDSNTDHAVFARSAVVCWLIARVATGQLRAHPYLNYQRGPSAVRGLCDRAIASIAAFTAGRRGRTFSALALELECVARDVDDARALARLPDLSDSLGRTQLQLSRLGKDLDSRARGERGADAMPGTKARIPGKDAGIGAQNDWPYLAI